MFRNRQRLPAYKSVIGKGTEIIGEVGFIGALHVDGKVVGNVSAQVSDRCALTLGQSGVIEGDVDVAHVVLDGTVKGDVRAIYRAELKAGARIEGKLYYGVLDVPEGAEINGELVRMDNKPQAPQAQGKGEKEEKEEK